jgi:hypothetical protein
VLDQEVVRPASKSPRAIESGVCLPSSQRYLTEGPDFQIESDQDRLPAREVWRVVSIAVIGEERGEEDCCDGKEQVE